MNDSHFKKLDKKLQDHGVNEEPQVQCYYSSGKLLLTGEYFVLDGARSLALPTKFGQEMTVKQIPSKELVWQSFDENKNCWLEACFELPKLRLFKADYVAATEGANDGIVETLFDVLKKVKSMQPAVFQGEKGLLVQTKLNFPRDWGLGTSSTLINNLASWAKINAYKLQDATFKGSGYDIAVAKHKCPLIYSNLTKVPTVQEIDYNPSFAENLYFVYLNKKQNSRAGIAHYRSLKGGVSQHVSEVSRITDAILEVKSLIDFEKLILEHEQLVSSVLKLPRIQKIHFSDYFGQIKSLGAWGGDFILATGNEKTKAYFENRGFDTILPYKSMIK